MASEPPDETGPDHPAEEARAQSVPPAPVATSPEPAVWTARKPKLPLFRLVLGALLVAGGALWLLDALNVFEVSFLYVLTGGLILVGLALMVGSMTGRHTGLIVVGIVLTVVLAFTSSFDIRLEGGVGQRVERPTVINGSAMYRLAIGMLTIDLRNVALSSRTGVTVSVGMGQLMVRLPPGGVSVEIRARAGAGDVMVLGQDESGFDVDHTFTSGTPPPVLLLDLRVGVGQISVPRVGSSI
jgi:hypothetical protein